jgi:hypothetical protein
MVWHPSKEEGCFYRSNLGTHGWWDALMSLMPAEQPRYEEMNDVVELYIKNVNPTKIARQLGLRRVDVLAHIDEWKRTAVGSEVMKDRVEELITSMDEHYSMLITKAYEIVEEVDRPLDEEEKKKETMTRSQMLSQKKGALDLIAKLEKDRIDILQKSGLLEAADVGDQLVEMEQKYDRVMDLLDEHLCGACTTKILGPLAQEMAGNVVIVKDDDNG